MLVKAFHLFFMVAWFAGLLYLPRLFVNHAMSDNATVRTQLSAMEHRLYRFITPWMLLTLAFGTWMLVDYAWTTYSNSLWLHLKLGLVLLLLGYHYWCGRIIKNFTTNQNKHSHVWYRWFNEVPAVILLAIILLTTLKPF